MSCFLFVVVVRFAGPRNDGHISHKIQQALIDNNIVDTKGKPTISYIEELNNARKK